MVAALQRQSRTRARPRPIRCCSSTHRDNSRFCRRRLVGALHCRSNGRQFSGRASACRRGATHRTRGSNYCRSGRCSRSGNPSLVGPRYRSSIHPRRLCGRRHRRHGRRRGQPFRLGSRTSGSRRWRGDVRCPGCLQWPPNLDSQAAQSALDRQSAWRHSRHRRSRAWSDGLSTSEKGALGETLGDARAKVNGEQRVSGSKKRKSVDGLDQPFTNKKGSYWYPDGGGWQRSRMKISSA